MFAREGGMGRSGPNNSRSMEEGNEDGRTEGSVLGQGAGGGYQDGSSKGMHDPFCMTATSHQCFF